MDNLFHTRVELVELTGLIDLTDCQFLLMAVRGDWLFTSVQILSYQEEKEQLIRRIDRMLVLSSHS